MPITYDVTWTPSPNGLSSVSQVYREGVTIGRVRRWQEVEPGELTREWFTAERWVDGFYVPIEGTHGDFQQALERIVFYGAGH